MLGGPFNSTSSPCTDSSVTFVTFLGTFVVFQNLYHWTTTCIGKQHACLFDSRTGVATGGTEFCMIIRTVVVFVFAVSFGVNSEYSAMRMDHNDANMHRLTILASR